MSKPMILTSPGRMEKVTQEEFIRRWMLANQGEHGVTVPEISQGTQIAYTTVYETIRRWALRGLVEGEGNKYQGRGKRPGLWKLNEEAWKKLGTTSPGHGEPR